MKALAARLLNNQILSRFNVKLVRTSPVQGGEAAAGEQMQAAPTGDPEAPPYPAALRQEHVAGARLFADREELMKSLAPLPSSSVAEIGVAYGDFSRFLLDQLQPRCFHAYDIFRFHESPNIWGRPTAEILKGLTHRQFYDEQFENEIASGQMVVFEGDSATELGQRPDASYDIIYIDADHHYRSVLRDATAAIPKLKPDGLLIFNDYILYDHIAHIPYGIVQVVNDLCVNHGWRITHFAFHQHMFCDVAIRRVGAQS